MTMDSTAGRSGGRLRPADVEARQGAAMAYIENGSRLRQLAGKGTMVDWGARVVRLVAVVLAASPGYHWHDLGWAAMFFAAWGVKAYASESRRYIAREAADQVEFGELALEATEQGAPWPTP